ncbi:hypothetical protein ABTC25_13230 [Acinetobacter baumannii]|uniref:hypothetical protein n=1 Tax=Acinetobacter baumannii TaxID=470 RepID=UPI00288D94C7|nr:hypothetical protein [Acinetobacter baumannii]MDT1911574.1 hypothetical protein [Acinetobacter baumannii]
MSSLYNSLKDKLDEYSFDGLENILFKENEDDLKKLLIDINGNVNLINQFPNYKIIKFRNFLKEFYLKKGIETKIFENIEIIEKLYRSILDEKKDFEGEKIRIIQNLFNFTREKLIEVDKLLKGKIDRELILNEIGLEVNNFDRGIESLCKIINYNLQSIAYSYPELVSKKNEIVLPFEVLQKNNCEIEFLKKSLLNTGMWDIVQDLDYDFRFFNNSLNKSILNGGNEILLQVNNLHLYAKIAMQRINMIHADVLVQQYKNYRLFIAQLNNVQKDLFFLRNLFYRLYFIDIDEDKTEYKGLTIKEWFLSFLSLRELSEAKGFNTVSFNEIIDNFKMNNISSSKHLMIINNLTYKKEKRADLYDTPIIKISDGSFLIFPLSIKNSDLEKVLSSIFSKFNLHIIDKGKLFEKEVLNTLKEKEKELSFSVSELEFSVNHIEKPQHQYDCILEWDNYIFIIECKNRSIPTTEYISLNKFKRNLEEYLSQVERLESGLINYTDKHKIKIKNKKIIKLILHSLPFSLDYLINNTYFIDYSSFLRFFSSKEIGLERISSQNISEIKEVLHTLWVGERPTVHDFINYLNKPPQVQYLKGKVKKSQTLHDLGDFKIKVERHLWEN